MWMLWLVGWDGMGCIERTRRINCTIGETSCALLDCFRSFSLNAWSGSHSTVVAVHRLRGGFGMRCFVGWCVSVRLLVRCTSSIFHHDLLFDGWFSPVLPFLISRFHFCMVDDYLSTSEMFRFSMWVEQLGRVMCSLLFSFSSFMILFLCIYQRKWEW